MSLIERRLERAIQEGEEVLHGQLGEPPNEEAWADLADLVIGDLADDYRGAVEERDRLRALLKAGAGARRLWLVWRPDGAMIDDRAVVVWNESDLREYRERGWGIEGPFADLVRLR
jgi:hypothetical protein